MADVIQTTRTLPRQALAAPRPRRRIWRGHLQGSEYAWALAFCVPYVVVFLAFVVYPVAFGSDFAGCRFDDRHFLRRR